MPRRSRSAKDPVAKAARVVTYPWRLKSRVQAVIRPAARVAGGVGMVMLIACGLLAETPIGEWPAYLEPSHLSVYVMVSVAAASLLGWTFVQDGQKRIERAIGETASLAAFVVVPITFAILGFIGAVEIESAGGPGRAHWLWTLVRWYGPGLVVASLVAFLTWKSRGRYGRGAWFGLLVAPYAALMAYLVFGLRVPGLGDAHHATVAALGTWAIALQLALAFFVGGGD